jgi:hypothetical protein
MFQLALGLVEGNLEPARRRELREPLILDGADRGPHLTDGLVNLSADSLELGISLLRGRLIFLLATADHRTG